MIFWYHEMNHSFYTMGRGELSWAYGRNEVVEEYWVLGIRISRIESVMEDKVWCMIWPAILNPSHATPDWWHVSVTNNHHHFYLKMLSNPTKSNIFVHNQLHIRPNLDCYYLLNQCTYEMIRIRLLFLEIRIKWLYLPYSTLNFSFYYHYYYFPYI